MEKNALNTKLPLEDSRFLIVGLGNPGRQYKGNRHNVGFMLADRLAERLGVAFSRMESRALVTKTNYLGKRLILAKPQTYMNLSGQAVAALVRFYKIPLDHLLIAYDDVDLPLGTIRIRPMGGSGGQKGMKSTIERLSTEEFPRIRLGVDRPPGSMEAAAYVLKDFSKDEAEMVHHIIDRASDAVLVFIAEGLEAAMNKYNSKDSD
ncbi:MAG: aminoacyl-tRNA hydrolase [Anaerolineales bacterium]|nr:aminoacyl-tRNA hydrolase [Anaerolineales bacterium]